MTLNNKWDSVSNRIRYDTRWLVDEYSEKLVSNNIWSWALADIMLQIRVISMPNLLL